MPDATVVTSLIWVVSGVAVPWLVPAAVIDKPTSRGEADRIRSDIWACLAPRSACRVSAFSWSWVRMLPPAG
jgi:hypothetical protein